MTARRRLPHRRGAVAVDVGLSGLPVIAASE
jgi:hypothetical protein